MTLWVPKPAIKKLSAFRRHLGMTSRDVFFANQLKGVLKELLPSLIMMKSASPESLAALGICRGQVSKLNKLCACIMLGFFI